MATQGNAGQPLGQFFWQHSASVLGVAYIHTSALGVIYVYSLFRRFGINIMDFVEANDVLFAAVKAPLGFFVSLPIALAVGASLVAGRPAKWPFSRRILLVLSAALISMLPSVIMGSIDGTRLREQGGTRVVLELQQSDQLPSSLGLAGDTTLVWTTQDFAFLYNHATQRIHMVPVAKVVSIQTLSMEPPERSTSMFWRLAGAAGLLTTPHQGDR